MHAPVVAYLINPTLELLDPYMGTHILAFIFLPVGIILIAIGTGALLRKTLPGVYSLLTGGRGL